MAGFSWNPFRRKQEVESSRSSVPNNPNYQVFSKINNDIAKIVNSRSMIQRAVQAQHSTSANPTWSVSFGDDFMALPVATNKQERISMYRSIA